MNTSCWRFFRCREWALGSPDRRSGCGTYHRIVSLCGGRYTPVIRSKVAGRFDHSRPNFRSFATLTYINHSQVTSPE